MAIVEGISRVPFGEARVVEVVRDVDVLVSTSEARVAQDVPIKNGIKIMNQGRYFMLVWVVRGLKVQTLVVLYGYSSKRFFFLLQDFGLISTNQRRHVQEKTMQQGNKRP
jgi:hypothetical protein